MTADMTGTRERPIFDLSYDTEERWLVTTDSEGASQIIARDVAPADAPYLLAACAVPQAKRDMTGTSLDELRAALRSIDLTIQAAAFHRKYRDALVDIQEQVRRVLEGTAVEPDTAKRRHEQSRQGLIGSDEHHLPPEGSDRE